MKKIAVQRIDGGVSIVIPSHEATDETMLRDAMRVEGYVSHREIEDDELPTFRDFRDAWSDNGRLIIHDMVKANNIKRNQFRDLRKPLMEKLDVDYMRADEAGNVSLKFDIAKQKQILRDVTIFQDIDDIKQLKEYMPEALKEGS